MRFLVGFRQKRAPLAGKRVFREGNRLNMDVRYCDYKISDMRPLP